MPELFNRLRRRGRGATVAALSLLAPGSGVAVGAPAASASTQCQWQPLSLQNGWHSEQSAWDSGDPAGPRLMWLAALAGRHASMGQGATW